jgi:hypothetical protein
MEIEVAVKTSLASNSPGTTTLQCSFMEALLCFILCPPKQEKTALKKIKEIIDFAQNIKLTEFASDR